MGFYETAYWLSDSWGRNRRERRSGAHHPYVPDTLAGRSIVHTAAAAAAVADAQVDIAVLNERATRLSDTEPLARLILRSEAMASSRIEGLEVGAGKLLEFEALDELGVPHRVDATEAAVLANITAMREGVDALVAASEVTVEDICRVNGMLLVGTRVEGEGGALRTVQNWIGGNGANPIGAAYVPPRPDLVPALMDDLVRFINTSALPPLSVAAIAHAQLETIHPFVDGNGRTGRALVHALLRRSGLAQRVVPPVSLVLATDRARYIEHLMAFRLEGDCASDAVEDEAIDAWVAYFAQAVSDACHRAAAFEEVLTEIEARWRERARPRRGSAADILLSKLVGNPVVSIASAARLTGRSYEAARQAIPRLVEAGILTQNARNRKSNIFVAKEVIEAFTCYERSLATLGGDTAEERPARPVPQRAPRSVASSAELLAAARRRHREDSAG